MNDWLDEVDENIFLHGTVVDFFHIDENDDFLLD